jgi:hypothetical protein
VVKVKCTVSNLWVKSVLAQKNVVYAGRDVSARRNEDESEVRRELARRNVVGEG